MAETETATLTVRLMNNLDVALIGAVAGYLLNKLTGNNRRNNTFP